MPPSGFNSRSGGSATLTLTCAASLPPKAEGTMLQDGAADARNAPITRCVSTL